MLHLIIDAACLVAGFGIGRIGKSTLAKLKALEATADADLKAAIEKVKAAL